VGRPPPAFSEVGSVLGGSHQEKIYLHLVSREGNKQGGSRSSTLPSGVVIRTFIPAPSSLQRNTLCEKGTKGRRLNAHFLTRVSRPWSPPAGVRERRQSRRRVVEVEGWPMRCQQANQRSAVTRPFQTERHIQRTTGAIERLACPECPTALSAFARQHHCTRSLAQPSHNSRYRPQT